ncbi:zinc knuckle [Trichuris suis]|nr:zinc knuckle [Trichuris suis]
MDGDEFATNPEQQSIEPLTKPKKRLKEERLRKQKRSERRRLRRQKKVMQSKVCYNCRESGHTVATCSKFTDDEAFGICFRCGSTEHMLQKCKLKIKG